MIRRSCAKIFTRRLAASLWAGALSLSLTGCAGMAATSGGGGGGAGTAATGLPGDSGVSGGAATYHIPIVVPPGRDELAPSLSLAYSSRSGDGMLGTGWYLNGYSSVHRCPATLAMDGYSAGVRYAATDRLCLDGRHLVLAGGKYGHDAASYRTEDDIFALVRESGDLNAPGAYFVVTYKNGLKTFYKAAFTEQGAPAPVSWYESWDQDRSGNVVSYHYTEPTPSEALYSEIRYTGRIRDGVIEEGDRVVRFGYEQRPDIETEYLAGGLTRQTRRLTTIVVGLDRPIASGGFHKLREYDLHYIQSRDDGHSLVSEIDACVYAHDGRASCYKPTTLKWEDDAVAFGEPQAYGVPTGVDGEKRDWKPGDADRVDPPYTRAYDYDGDGRTEIAYQRQGEASHLYFTDIKGALVKDVTVDGLVHEDGPAWTQAQADLLDIGAGTLVGRVDGNLAVSAWDGKAMGAPLRSSQPLSGEWTLADVDSDNQMDLVQLETRPDHSRLLRLYINDGSGPGRLAFKPGRDLAKLPAPASGRYTLKRGDLDGNGLSDVLVYDGDRLVKLVLFSQDSSGALASRVLDPRDYGLDDHTQSLHPTLMDINGDGLDDLVYADDAGQGSRTWRYQLNTGTGFGKMVDTGARDARATGTAVSGTFAADIVDDGGAELLYPAERLVEYCLAVTGQDGAPRYLCSGDELGSRYPDHDLGIYHFDALRFTAGADGRYTPQLLTGLNLVAQANLAAAGDLQGDGLTDVLSAFDPWYANGWFRGADGKYSRCPPKYGCGLHVASSVSAARPDRRDAPARVLLAIDDGAGGSASWHYFPLSNPVRSLYSAPGLGTPERYLGSDRYYFTSSMYVVGDFSRQDRSGGNSWDLQYGDAIYNGVGRGMRGFKWVIENNHGNGIKTTQWYLQEFPYSGELARSWTEKAEETGDDVRKGVPGPHYIYDVQHTYDCQGPTNTPEGRRGGCSGADVPTYHVRERKSVATGRDRYKFQVYSVETKTFEYDAYGNTLKSTDAEDDRGTQKYTLATKSYAPADLDAWWVDKLLKESTTKTPGGAEDTGPDGQEGADHHEGYDYDYNARRQPAVITVDKSTLSVILIPRLTYEEDPSKPTYGEVIKVDYDIERRDSHEQSYSKSLSYEYSADGYYTLAEIDSENGATRYEYDPDSGLILKQTNPDGSWIEYVYDAFGHQLAKKNHAK
jgi:hypothetical protein